MTELEMLERAKMYMDKLANGINPIDDTTIPDNDVVNNIRLSRCFFFVSDVLRQVIENGGVTPANKKKIKKADFSVTFDVIQKFPFSDTPIPCSTIAGMINDLVGNENMKKITHKHISDWFISVGMLEPVTLPDGKNTKRPTPAGNEMGITTEHRTGMRGEYNVVVYNRSAQQFLVDNIDAVIDMMNVKK